ncbi:hypothetical protein L2E82_47227 [Cichorium intybus]|uniref:Uncharacterized protein n=1 Tax=Cichorium intybus TaxID=13427 RepID=A0ACB8YWE1_CICIN|nr:hypothetical protein L2E82_47227 [Cichorium intybus]
MNNSQSSDSVTWGSRDVWRWSMICVQSFPTRGLAGGGRWLTGQLTNKNHPNVLDTEHNMGFYKFSQSPTK